MAGALIRSGVMAGLASMLALGLALGLASAASAEALSDPTRPPVGMSGKASGAPWEAKTETPDAPLLQSVILHKGAEPRALVNGEWLRQGQTFGDLKIMKILVDRVVIKGPQGRQTLKMMPNVEMNAVASVRTGMPQQGKNE